MSTMNSFASLIILENVFCVNRSYLIESSRRRTIGNAIFFLTFSSFLTVAVYYMLTSSVSVGNRMFQLVLVLLFADLVITARLRRLSFAAFKRLDEKCGLTDEYISELTAKSTKYAVFSFCSAIIDVFGMKVLNLSSSEIFLFAIIYSAQDTELMFLSMIVEAINWKISRLSDVSPDFGCKVYRHVLVAAAQLNEECTPNILLLLAVILGTSVLYSSVIMLSLTDTNAAFLLYLLWRELKAFFCLWRVCYASWKTEKICQQLTFHLAKTLALDPSVDKGKDPQAHSTVYCWYSTILRERPRFGGSMLSIGLSIPLHLIDVSVNYVLIIVQIYVAYK